MLYDIELNSAAHYPVAGIVELSPLIEQAGFSAFWTRLHVGVQNEIIARTEQSFGQS